MRLAFILHHYFPYGGLQRDALRIASACKEQGHQIEFLTMNWQGPALKGATIKFFPQTHITHHKKAQSFAHAVQKYLQQHPYDGTIGFNKMPGLDIYYAADPCLAARIEKRRFAKLYQFLPRYRYLLQTEKQIADPHSKTHLFLISPQALKDFQKYYHTPEKRLHYLLPGIDPNRRWQSHAEARREKMREKLGLSQEKKLILMLGSAFKTKGVDRGIRALASLPPTLRKNSELFIVGKGNAKPFQKLAHPLQIEKQLHFIPGSDEVPELLLAADLLLHPAYVENTGTVILEAIVAGLPVLTTANCGYAFYVEQAQAGIVVPEPFDQEILNQQLSYMLTATEYPQWQKNAIQFGKTADVYSMPEYAAQLITKIIEDK